MTDQTPTTEEVEFAYWMYTNLGQYGRRGMKHPEFRAWLDAHDREVAARASTAERERVAAYIDHITKLHGQGADNERLTDVARARLRSTRYTLGNLANAIRDGQHNQ